MRYDAMFNLIEELDIPFNFGDLRTLEVDRSNGNLLVLINSNRVLTEFTPDLKFVRDYSTIQADTSATAGVALDPVTNTTWAAGVFTGVVTQYSREGQELSSFQVDVDVDDEDDGFFNSVAVDWVNGTVLLFDPLPDRLEEYTFDGEFVGTPFRTVINADNSFIRLHSNLNFFTNGIYYDSETARLYAISDGGNLAIWEDRSRLPEEVLLGDVNRDGTVNFSDIVPFIEVLAVSGNQAEADINQDGIVNFSDIVPFIALITSS